MEGDVLSITTLLEIAARRADQIRAVRGLRRTLPRAAADRRRGSHPHRPSGRVYERGLDSTTAAATARRICQVRAFTVVYDTLIPDRERYYSTIAAQALHIPIHHLPAGGYNPLGCWDQPQEARPDPDTNPFRPMELAHLQKVAADHRVALYAEGPDNLLSYEWKPYVRALIRRFDVLRLAADVGFQIISQRRLPFVGRLSALWTRCFRGHTEQPTYPPWIDPDFALRTRLVERWQSYECRTPLSTHPFRPAANASLELVNWRDLFESGSSGETGVPLEIRYPFMDLRMVRYLLAVPAVPWCADKHLVRKSMRGMLPEAVRRRPKAPLAGDPLSEYWTKQPDWWRDAPRFDSSLTRYVDVSAFRNSLSSGTRTVRTNWNNLRPFALQHWLRNLETQPRRRVSRYETTIS